MNRLSAVGAIGLMAAALLLAPALSTPPSAAGPEPGHARLPLSTPAFVGSPESVQTPAPPRLAAIPAAAGPAGVQARYCTDLIRNGGFESGNFLYWTTSGAPVVLSTGGHTGSHSAQLGGRDNALDSIAQTVSCPFSGDLVQGGHYLYMHTSQPTGAGSDVMRASVLRNDGGGFDTWIHPGDLAPDTWHDRGFSVEMSPYACEPGKTWQIEFEAATDASNPTWFLVDDVSLELCCFEDIFESNNSFAASRFVGPGSYYVRLCPSGDEDWFRFDVTAGQLIFLRLQIVEAGQTTVCLVSPAGEEVGCDWDIYPYTATLARTATMSGSWRARVHDPGYHTFGKLLRLSIEISDVPTATPTATATRTRTPTPTRTLTPTPTRTPTGVTRRVYLPVVLKNFWQPRPEDCTERMANGAFETGALAPWSIYGNTGLGGGRGSAFGAWLGGQNNAGGEVFQGITLPDGANPVPWTFWWKAETASPQPNDALIVRIECQGEEPHLLTLRADGALNEWRQDSVDLSAYAGKFLLVAFQVSTDASVPTTFRVDDVSVKACVRP